MYNDFFSFDDSPFNVTPDHEFIYYGDKHFEALSQMLYGVKERKGFIVLTGPVGSGKTTLSRAFLQEVGEDTSTALVLNSRMNSDELLQSIVEDFGLEPPDNPTAKELIDCLNEFLLSEFEDGRNVCVILDESQNLSPEALENLRLLSNLETEKHKLLQIILVGQPELNDLLDKRKLRQLRQRINVWVNLTNLSREETEQYVEHRLEEAGNSSVHIDDEAYDLIYRKSSGNPRSINLICDRTFLAAYVKDETTIRKHHVETALENLSVDLPDESDFTDEDVQMVERTSKDSNESSVLDYLPSAQERDKLYYRYGLTTLIVLLAIMFTGLLFWNYRAESSFLYGSETQHTSTTSTSKSQAPSQDKSDNKPSNRDTQDAARSPSRTIANPLGVKPLNLSGNKLPKTRLDSLVLARLMSYKLSKQPGSVTPSAKPTEINPNRSFNALIPEVLPGRWLIFEQPSAPPETFGYIGVLTWSDQRGKRYVLYFPEKELLWDPLDGTRTVNNSADFTNWTGTFRILTRSTFNPVRVYRPGEQSKQITKLQQLINSMQNYSVTVSSRYDSETRSVVQTFQERNNLLVDGLSGPRTNLSLLSQAGVEFLWTPDEIRNFIRVVAKCH
ncbi:MAG: AAA family ATPase [bacterium]